MTWEEYKDFIKSTDSVTKLELEEIEAEAKIISSMIEQRNELGLSQRDLASLCGIPQSSVARIECNKTMPRLDTLIKILQRLGLTLTVTPYVPSKKL